MNGFSLHLQSAPLTETLVNVTSFIGADKSGSFGLMAGHERMMTVLEPGLCRFRPENGEWQYVAVTGGILYFNDGNLCISTRRYIRGEDYRTVSDAIRDILSAEEAVMHDLKGSISRLEQEMTRRLWRLQHGQEEVYGR
ncbi:MAG TPA: F0F1 ATP synthase subunit epsilon [Alphaproteobacteria bacterium]|nr:F0F1 ATP synthase subunit epsilon [Alphaproteobacteria bacterium]